MANRFRMSLAAAILLVPTVVAFAQARVDSSVIYGMYGGAALLMDVHYPSRSNGLGVIFIPGSGWRVRPEYAAVPLKESTQVAMYVPSLTAAGYTVFALSHRATPAFRYPAIFEDVQRAIRYIRYHASKYGIDPTRIGGSGGSSGAHLLSLAATVDGAGDPNDPDPVNRQSARLQCIVSRAGPMDLTSMWATNGAELVSALLGGPVDEATPKHSDVFRTAWSASPLAHVSSDDPPFLFVHGDADKTVPFSQSTKMQAALTKVSVASRVIRIDGADHGPDFPGAKNAPDYKQEMVRWFDTYLRTAR